MYVYLSVLFSEPSVSFSRITFVKNKEIKQIEGADQEYKMLFYGLMMAFLPHLKYTQAASKLTWYQKNTWNKHTLFNYIMWWPVMCRNYKTAPEENNAESLCVYYFGRVICGCSGHVIWLIRLDKWIPFTNWRSIRPENAAFCSRDVVAFLHYQKMKKTDSKAIQKKKIYISISRAVWSPALMLLDLQTWDDYSFAVYSS